VNADGESAVTAASCRRCGTGLAPGATVCAACGASTVTATGNALVGVALGFAVGCVVAILTIFLDLEVSGHGRLLATIVVEGTFVVLGIAFFAGIASFVARAPRLAFLLMTAAFVAALPATAFGFFTLACLQT
jgi:hypothetical protein